MSDTKIVSMLSTKGGTGKTTQTFNLGLWLAHEGYKVLLIDHDHQCNLTQAFNIYEPENTIAGIYEKEFNAPAVQNVRDNLDLIAGSMHLDRISEGLNNRTQKEFIMYNWFSDHSDIINLDSYDYVLIDCHPDMGTMQKNAIMLSDHIVSFVEPSQFGGLDAMNSIEDRLALFKKEARIPRTKESYVVADLIFVGNKIAHNTTYSRQLVEAVKDRADVVAFIDQKEAFNHSTADRISIFDIPDNTSSYKDFLKRTTDAYSKIKTAIDK